MGNDYFRRKAAFTLAEVLITLGIIGVVAALTMPSLIAHYRKQEIETRLKHFYSIINQAVMLSEVHNGEAEYWDYTDAPYGQDASAWVNKYLAPYMKVIDIYDPKDEDSYIKLCTWAPIFVLENGISFSAVGDSKVAMCVWLTGKTQKEGVNVFRFMFNPTRYASKVMPDSYLEWVEDAPVGYMPINGDRDNLMKVCKRFPLRCAALIMHDSWKILDDYPYKI